MESYSSSDHDEDSKQRGLSIKSKANKAKFVIPYNRKGVPVGNEATKLSTFEGLVGRTMVPINYASWLDVSDETKDELWQYVLLTQRAGSTLSNQSGRSGENSNIIYMPNARNWQDGRGD
ncbi:unnamed protein product [Lactuca virosa]|uniref:Uncharacterized protein n=1 Tax=Lactuca virosa TaxID=75947 RepID=A0AAU9MQZ3_9ASTR|nr:unnamed protein product [Lactuca virosa]